MTTPDQPADTALEESADLPQGFSAGGAHCGIKPRDPDLALIVSDRPAALAGMFTTNRVPASCVAWCRARVAGGTARAVIVNSGNANACTGEQGERDTAALAALTARAIGCDPDEVCVSSTGSIGIPLPMERIESGIDAVAGRLSTDSAAAAAAIMTTDTAPKTFTAVVAIEGVACRITGIAKGAGMIHPGMATMLAYLLTDAAVAPQFLQSCLGGAVAHSFNRITVDGDRSTNDTVLALANGAAGTATIDDTHPDSASFARAVNAVCLALALCIVRDGEGSSKLVTLDVRGAVSDADADRAARAIGNSLLCKTSWAGSDPNWGRILCALGYSDAQVDPATVDVDYEDVPAVRRGSAADTPIAALKEVASRNDFTIHIDLHQGNGTALLYACDTTEAYVRINVEE